MTGFASKLIGALFGKASPRPTAERRRRAALRFEPLEPRAVLSTVMPTTTADDVVVDGGVITGETVEMATRRHTGGANFLFVDGSVRFISDTIAFRAAGAAESGGGAGKVAMQDFPLFRSTADRSRSTGVNVVLADGSVRFISDTLIVRATGTAGAGAPGGHVKVFDGSRSEEPGSFFAFGGFNGGVVVGASDVDGDRFADIITGAGPGAGAHVKAFDGRDTGIDYNHPDLYKNIWINQSLESTIDDLASAASSQDDSR